MARISSCEDIKLCSRLSISMPGGPSAKVISAPRLLCVWTWDGSPYTFSRVGAAGKGGWLVQAPCTCSRVGWLVQAPCTCSRVGATVSWRRKGFHFLRLTQMFACTTHPNYRFLAIQFSPSVYILLAFNFRCLRFIFTWTCINTKLFLGGRDSNG